MPPKTTRSTRSKLTGTQTTSTTTRSVDASSQTPESDLMQMPLEGLVRYISEQNNDPLVGNLLEVLLHRLPKSSPLDLELDKRSRSIVISGLPEADGDVSFQDRRTHLDNQRRGGGVCCLLKGHLVANVVQLEEHIMVDVLAVKIFHPEKASHLQFAVVYRPPNSSKRDDDELIQLLTHITSTNNHTIVLGDFNLQIDWSNKTCTNPASNSFLEFFSRCGLHQNVTLPTHSNNILDLVLSSTAIVSNVNVLPPLGSSDHNIVSFRIHEDFSNSIQPLPDFLNVDYSALDDFLACIDWISLFDQYSSCSEVYTRFCTVIYGALGKFVPIKPPNTITPTLPPHIQALICQKQRLFREIQSPLSSPLYKKVCRDIEHHLRKYQANYERRLASKASSKKLYQYVRHRIKLSSRLPTLADSSGNLFVKDADKANALGLQFSSVFLAQSSCEVSSLNHIFPASHPCSNVLFNRSDVLHILKSLKPSLTLTFDGIPQIIYREQGCNRTTLIGVCDPPVTPLFGLVRRQAQLHHVSRNRLRSSWNRWVLQAVRVTW
ncbi:hypothetical protein Y032_0467g1986 [Ancylostoma ceylanicum]|uniref:Endonuclease/exonuclease/phosphatase domain-containing protein n=1 Tax=Ancylostoma ceylanicum TaxID=53326 RepID=A0A016WYZ0_9BILA|nr:hypothetical protein Y032_0467g1986 [Ancylostoma ceylanicum]